MARHGRIRPHDAILALQVLFQAALAVEPAETRVRVGTDLGNLDEEFKSAGIDARCPDRG